VGRVEAEAMKKKAKQLTDSQIIARVRPATKVPSVKQQIAAARKSMKVAKPSKYRNKRTVVDGIMFASQREAKRYSELKLLQEAGKIDGLRLQVKLPCYCCGNLICTYIADFWYGDLEKHACVIEDAKGFKTPVYRLKKKLVEAIYGIEIVEV
jgi:hypothetical protein